MKQLKSMLLVVFLFTLVTVICTPANASINPNIVVGNYTISENPAQPSHTVDLGIQVNNIDPDVCANRVQVQLSMAYPLSIDGGDTKYIGDLCPGNMSSTVVYFKVVVDPLAQKGTYPIAVLTTYEKDFNKFSQSNTMNVRVGGVPDFSASVTSSKPLDIYPGDEASVTVNFQNNGAGQADSTRVVFTAPPGIDVKWAGAEQNLGLIAARGSATATFYIEAAKNAVPGIYEINATLEYVNEDGTQTEQILPLEMPISAKAEFSAYYGAPFYAGDEKLVTITLKNTGFEEAKKLKVRIMPIFPFSTDGTVRYIDSLMPGQSSTIAYVVHVDADGTAGAQTAGLIINFEDPQGKQFTDTIDVAFTVAEKDVVYYLLAYWWLIVLIIIAVIAFRKQKEIKAMIAKRRAAGKSAK